jgi:hypothetical protein
VAQKSALWQEICDKGSQLSFSKIAVIIVLMSKRLPFRRFAVFCFFAGLFALGVYFFFFSKAKLPQQFLDARQNAALVSQKIVDLTEITNQKIKSINLEDFNGNANAAIRLINEARESNAQAYAKASELAGYLQKLAESLADLNSRESQRNAYEAVAVELSLVSEFIVYTQSLNDFFDSLTKAIVTDSLADRKAVEEKLRKVNEQAKKINQLNGEFLSKMRKFDKSL